MENLLATVLKTQFFWRERQNKVDFVLEEDRKRIPIEVKWKEKVKNRDLKGILNFCEKFHADKGIILTRSKLKEEKVNSLHLYFIPVWIYFLKD